MAEYEASTELSSMKLPYSPESEQALLGAIVWDPDCMSRVVVSLPKPEFFYLKVHRTIYRVMLEMYTAGKAMDFQTILESLRHDPDFDEASNKTYFIDIVQSSIAAENVMEYVSHIREAYDKRMLVTASKRTIEEVLENVTPSDTLLDAAEQRIFDIRQGKDIQGLVHIRNVIQETYDRLDILNSDENEELKPISTGILSLDNYITGLNKSDLILLAARPGMGKTAFALNIAAYAATKLHKRIAFFSLEMSKEQLSSRLLSTTGTIESQKIKTGKMTDDEWSRLISAGDVLSNSEMYLDDTPSITVPAMKAKLRRLKGVELVVIDYLQLLQSGRRIENRVQEVSDITRNLKILAKELNVPVITLSQLSRASEQRADHRPQLSDMRDSGSIEQDADIVLFLYRKGYYKDGDDQSEDDSDDEDRNSAECIVAKNRHGEMGTVPLHWSGELMRFTARDI